MQHPLQKQVVKIGRQARWLTIVHGAGYGLSLTALLAAMLATIDFLVRSRSTEVPYLIFGGWLAGAVGIITWFVIPSLRFNPSIVQIAHHIEQRFPQLRDRLTSSLLFLSQQDESPHGSAELQAAVIDDTMSLVRQVDLGSSIERKPTQRAIFVTIVVAIAIGLTYGSVPDLFSTAAKRLFLPWSDTQWPQRNNLKFIELPPFVTKGSDLTVEVVDVNRHLPTRVVIETRADATSPVRSYQVRARNGRALLVLKERITPLQVRAWGGDDETSWHNVMVVDPPKLESVTFQVRPPEYSGLPVQDFSESVIALVGSSLRIRGQANRAIDSAELVLTTSGGTSRMPCKVADGNQISIPVSGAVPFIVSQSGSMQIKLVDSQGIVGGDRQSWALIAENDSAPAVLLFQSEAIRTATPRAIIPFQVRVEDNLEIAGVEIEAKQNGMTILRQAIDLDVDGIDPNSVDRASSPLRQFETTLSIDLATLSDIQIGHPLTITCFANDRKPQTSRSEPLEIAIVSNEQLQSDFAAKQASILSKLNEALNLQQQTLNRTERVSDQLQNPAQWINQRIDPVELVQLGQNQVNGILFEPGQGVQAMIHDVLSRLEINRMETAQLYQRLSDARDALNGLELERIARIDQSLQQAKRQITLSLERWKSQPDTDATLDSAETDAALSDTEAEQIASVAILQALVESFSHWGNFGKIELDIKEIQQKQRENGRVTEQLQSEDLANRVLGGSDKAEWQAELENRQSELVQRQYDLASDFDQAVLQMMQLQGELALEDLATADLLRDVVESAYQDQIGQRMQEAANDLQQGRIGKSSIQQQEIDRLLTELVERLGDKDSAGNSDQSPSDDPGEAFAAQLDTLLKKQLLVRQSVVALDDSRPRHPIERTVNAAGELAATERTLKRETESLSESIPESIVIREYLDQAVVEMSAAANGLDQAETGSVTQNQLDRVLDYLSDILQALPGKKSDDPTEAETSPPDQGLEQEPTGEDNAVNRMFFAELRLLRGEQQLILKQTVEIEAKKAEAQQDEINRLNEIEATLAARQGRLAELLALLAEQIQATTSQPSETPQGTPQDVLPPVPGF